MADRFHIREWFAELRGHVDKHPVRAPLYLLFTLYLTVWYTITSRRPIGTNIFEEEWDLLIVLDACRVDALREVADEYTFIDEVDARWSVGSQSAEWLANTFTERHRPPIHETTYISANGYSGSVLKGGMTPPANNTIPIDLSRWSIVDETNLHRHVKLWETHHDDRYRSVLPFAVTDHAIHAGRNESTERLIAHYTQPHLPYVGRAYNENRDPTEVEDRGYELLEEGAASRDEVYEAYKETLRWVLDDVEELLRNIDAEQVVITADHGEAFGEWFAYGHPEGFPHPVVRKVPWVETTATDQETREPDLEPIDDHRTSLEDHLRDLGYR